MDAQAVDLSIAYDGSYYTICGAGGDLAEWENGYNDLMAKEGIGHPLAWFQTTGEAVNAFAAGLGQEVTNPFSDDLTILMFPIDGLHAGKLAIFKLMMQDRWFDDIVNNMTPAAEDDEA
jgi:hypothetical protein